MPLKLVSQDQVDRSGLGTPGWTRVHRGLQALSHQVLQGWRQKTQGLCIPQGWRITVQGFGGHLSPEAKANLAGRIHASSHSPTPQPFFPFSHTGAIWDLSSLTRDQTPCPLQWQYGVLTTRRPRMFPGPFYSWGNRSPERGRPYWHSQQVRSVSGTRLSHQAFSRRG